VALRSRAGRRSAPTRTADYIAERESASPAVISATILSRPKRSSRSNPLLGRHPPHDQRGLATNALVSGFAARSGVPFGRDVIVEVLPRFSSWPISRRALSRAPLVGAPPAFRSRPMAPAQRWPAAGGAQRGPRPCGRAAARTHARFLAPAPPSAPATSADSGRGPSFQGRARLVSSLGLRAVSDETPTPARDAQPKRKFRSFVRKDGISMSRLEAAFTTRPRRAVVDSSGA